jgi:hypothetical protein
MGLWSTSRGSVIYLIIEGGLDLVTDWISDWRRERGAKVHIEKRDR